MLPVIDIVRDHPFTHGLDESCIGLLADCATAISATNGDVLLREGEPADAFYLMRYGAVALQMYIPERATCSFMTLKGGDPLGLNSIVANRRYAFDAIATEPVQAIRFDAQCVRQLCESDNAFGYAVLKRFLEPTLERLRQTRFECARLYGESRAMHTTRFE